MKKIHKQVLAGESKTTIMGSLSKKEKSLFERYRLAWLDSVPVITEFGPLKLEYLPVDHVVVYGTPEFQAGRKKWAQEAYVNANGFRSYCFENGAISLELLIQTTRYGTSAILKGSVSDISQIPNPERYKKDTLYEYVLLKKLIMKSHDFLEFAFDLAFRTEPRTQVYVEKLLRDSVASPPLPEVGLGWNKKGLNEWESWYQENAADIKLSNKFLFEE